MTTAHFSRASLTSKASMLAKNGIYVGQRKPQQPKVSLYALEDFFVEVFYNKLSGLVDRIEVMSVRSYQAYAHFFNKID